jgi:predicted ATPase
MRPYCERLAEVQDTPSALRESLQALYTDIIWDALMARPLAMLLDDVHQFDEASAAVLEAVVQRGCSAAAHRVFGEVSSNGISMLLCCRP